MFKKSNLILAVFVAVFFGACSLKSGDDMKNSSLENSKWELISLNQKEIKKLEKVANINFEKDRVFGNLGCNNFFGAYKLNKDSLEIGQVGSNMMMCIDMSVENEFSKVLQNVKTYKIDNSSLIFFDKDVVEIAKFRKE
ncbi:hypothetical protein CRU87_01870 [Aliarcobacter trophiarum LMG 25534]|uniref:META domain-containing protein n=1 Tax=Aliarcobacter trophiarum LMG 25534 TaxID=1032241 RepID=A0AAD0VLM9_9BACT|nr:META domain-containing protein [Aliarcobacter trophiarum]AXK48060.1 META domain-containing protein [Aliarcobacter trophiarum LMG 25534]RXJ93258.1 hypothetical protein CRU87_01870 [Aliarcobacter trophiarum LMG 25534]